MSGKERPSFAVQARVSDAATATRPSWISRRTASSRPPTPPPAPAATEASIAPPPEPLLGEAPQPAPAVDLGMSVELARLTEENASLHAKIAEMAATMARLRRDVLQSSEPELVRLAVTIAERVVGRELALEPALVVAWTRDAIEALAAKGEVIIALARDVAQQVPAEAWSAIEVDHTVQADASLAPSTIEVRTSDGVVAAGFEARLTAVAQALGVTEP
jgi:hypothetical protein